MTRFICSLFIITIFAAHTLSVQKQDSAFAILDTSELRTTDDATSEASDSILQEAFPEEPDTIRNKKIKIIRRNFNYRTQIGAALFMMGFVVLILTSVDNWNPN